MTNASLNFKGKSAIGILYEARGHFKDDDQWLAFLESKTLMALTHALCSLDDNQGGWEDLTGATPAEAANGRAIAFLAMFDLDSRLANTVNTTSIPVGPADTNG
jgi:hypothetical protein